jgi:hypothetical protein
MALIMSNQKGEHMKEKQWYEKTWDEMSSVRLINKIQSWSDFYDFSTFEPTEDQRETYKLMYEKAKRIDPDNYKLLGCILPEHFGKRKKGNH